MKKFVLVILVIIAILTWNNAAFGCEAFNAETMQHTGNYSSTSIIEWEETVMEEPTVEEPTKEEEMVVESTITETIVEEEQSIVTEEPVTEEPVTEEHTVVNSSAKAEIKAKAEEEVTGEVAPAGVTEKHFVQTGLLEDYRSLENKVIYFVTALIVAMLLYMPYNRKKAEARKERKEK